MVLHVSGHIFEKGENERERMKERGRKRETERQYEYTAQHCFCDL